MPSVSEFERSKPIKTHKSIIEAKEKYEKLVKSTVVMEDTDAVRVEMANSILKDLNEIYKNFIAGL